MWPHTHPPHWNNLHAFCVAVAPLLAPSSIVHSDSACSRSLAPTPHPLSSLEHCTLSIYMLSFTSTDPSSSRAPSSIVHFQSTCSRSLGLTPRPLSSLEHRTLSIYMLSFTSTAPSSSISPLSIVHFQSACSRSLALPPHPLYLP